jgi:hypothetical protein
MPFFAKPTADVRLQSRLWIALVLAAGVLGGSGCGRSRMADLHVTRADGDTAQPANPDAAPDGRPSDRAIGGNAGTGAPGMGGGTAGAGGAGGAGGVSMGAGGAGGVSAGGTGAIDASAEPLWRSSYEPFCQTADAGSLAIDLWSDDRGVFLLTSESSTNRPAIWTNLGTGWRLTFDWPGEVAAMYQGGLKGFADGPLVVYGGLPCGIQFVDGTNAECSGAASLTTDLSVVGADLAYAVCYDRVLKFDGDLWTQVGGALPGLGLANAVWADSATIVVAAGGSRGESLVFTIEADGDAVLLPGLSSQVEPMAVWSFGASEIWVGGAQGQLVRYDGTAWSEKATIPYTGSGSKPVSGTSGIGKIKLWGNGGRLFAIAGNTFGEWDGARFKVLDSLGGDSYFAGLWGNSSSEVFLAVQDPRSAAAACAPIRIRWFDGTAVGPL